MIIRKAKTRASKNPQGKRVYKAIVETTYSDGSKDTQILRGRQVQYFRSQGTVFAEKDHAIAYANEHLKELLDGAKAVIEKRKRLIERWIGEGLAEDSPRIIEQKESLEVQAANLAGYLIDWNIEHDPANEIHDGAKREQAHYLD